MVAGTTVGDVADAHGRAAGSGLDDELPSAVDVVGLRADEAEDELVVLLVEAGRVDDVGGLDGVDEVEEGDARGLQLREVGDDVELGNLAALDGDGADAVDAVERRLERVGGELPELRLRDSVVSRR